MDVSTLLADPTAIRLECCVSEPQSITLLVRTVQSSPSCPKCQQPSASLHSHYWRTLADLPWHGVAVRLHLRTRKFRCGNQDCRQKVFCERLPQAAAPYARKTVRLNHAFSILAFALGGQAGARAACGLGLQVSGDSLLRRIRRAPLPPSPTPRVLGVDDWAKRKGTAYGTILVDLERRRPIDLLPDRESATLTAWLKEHPGVEVISRDRAGAYAEGSRRGAPRALQVADRFHLFKNISETLEHIIQRHYQEVRLAAQTVATALPPPSPEQPAAVAVEDVPQVVPLTASEYMRSRVERQRRQRLHALRKEKYDQVKQLQQQGLTINQARKQLGLHYGMVANFFRAEEYPAIRRGKRTSAADQFDVYLRERWAAGCRNARQLYREVCARGFSGREITIRRHVQLWREHDDPTAARLLPPPPKVAVPLPRACTWLLLRDESKLTEHEQLLRETLLERSPAIRKGREIVTAFRDLISNRQAGKLTAWMQEAEQSKLTELENFALVLRRDEAAVRAAATSEWSNGQTEGQINRLKFLKRQMFGRAKFDLLRARVLHQPSV